MREMPDARNFRDGLVPVERPAGVWVAYHSDSEGLSGVVVFPTEVEALRRAVSTHLSVAFLPFGKDLSDLDVELWDQRRKAGA